MTRNSKWLAGAWLVVALLWTVGCLNYLDRVMLTTMRGSVKEAIPMTDAQFGLLTSIFLWVYGGLSPFAGFLADRLGRSRVIIAGMLAWTAITWLTGHSTTFHGLLTARAVMGISEAFFLPAALALVADYHPGPTRSLATGILISGTTVGAGLGGLGGWLAEHHGWNYSYYLLSGLGVACSVLLVLVLRDAPRLPDKVSAPGVRFGDALSSLFSRGSFIVALVYWGLLGLAGWALIGWMPTYFNEHFHLAQGVAGLSATGYLQAAVLVGLPLGGALADRWNRTNPRGRILVPVIGLCVAAPGLLLAANTNIVALALAGLVLYGLARASTDANMMPIICLVTDSRYRATGYGVLNCFACIVGGLAIYAGGVLRDAHFAGLNRVFQIASVSLVLCAGLLLLVKPSAMPGLAVETGSLEPPISPAAPLIE
jgi:MFS family permease